MHLHLLWNEGWHPGTVYGCVISSTLQWRHNGHDGVSNHQLHDCLLTRLFRRRSKKASKPRVTGLWERNSPAIGEFPAQRASNAENVSIWWRHQGNQGVTAVSTRHWKLLWWNYNLLVDSRDVIDHILQGMKYNKNCSANWPWKWSLENVGYLIAPTLDTRMAYISLWCMTSLQQYTQIPSISGKARCIFNQPN